MKEQWKDIDGFEGIYQVSDLGRVKSNYSKKILKCSNIGNSGYAFVNLYKDKKPKNRMIHQLVAIAFLGHTPCGQFKTIDHIDGDRTNNKLYNLKIVNQRQNTNKSISIGKSGFRGVVWSVQNKKWQVRPRVKGRKVLVGYYNCPMKAAKSYLDFTSYIDSLDLQNITREELRDLITEYKQKAKQLK
jgi:hypothetical protein